MTMFANKSNDLQGGKLVPTTTGKIMLNLFEEDPILAQEHFELMKSPKHVIPRTMFQGKILKGGSSTDSYHAPITDGLKAGLSTSAIELNAVEVLGFYDVPLKFLRQNIESEGFVDSLAVMATDNIRAELAHLIWHSDKDYTGADEVLKLQDGILKLAGKVTVDGTLEGVALIRAVYSKFPTQYVKKLAKGKGAFYVTREVFDTVRDEIGDRVTALGDVTLTDGGQVFINGIEVIHSPGLDDESVARAVVLTVKENVKYGVFEDVKINVADNFRNGTKEMFPILEFACAIQVPEATIAYVEESV